jgi:hypothetical protein
LDTHGTSGKLGQSNAPNTGPRCVKRCPSAPGEIADLHDTFHGRHCHGLHALPITVLGERVGLEVGDEGIEVGEHPLGRCPSTYAAHAIKIVSEPFQKKQCSNMQCQRPKHRIAGDSTLLKCQTRRTEATNCDSNLSTDTDFGRTARACRAHAQSCTTSGRPLELNPRRMAAPRGYGRAPPAPARRRRLAMAL